MPPYSFGTNGHHSPCARAFLRRAASTLSNPLESSSFSAGMHSSCTHLRTFSRIALASAGTSKSSMALPRWRFLMILLGGWHNATKFPRQRQTKFEAMRSVVSREGGGTQYAAAVVVHCGVGVYWIIRFRG